MNIQHTVGQNGEVSYREQVRGAKKQKRKVGGAPACKTGGNRGFSGEAKNAEVCQIFTGQRLTQKKHFRPKRSQRKLLHQKKLQLWEKDKAFNFQTVKPLPFNVMCSYALSEIKYSKRQSPKPCS